MHGAGACRETNVRSRWPQTLGGCDAPTLTGWLVIDGRSFRLYPTATKPADNSPCVSGVLLSLAGMPTPDFSDRVMNVSGYVLDKNDPGAEGAANPCQSSVIITAIEVDVPDA